MPRLQAFHCRSFFQRARDGEPRVPQALYYTILYYTIYPILSYPILSCPILSYPILHYTILYYTMLCYAMLCYAMLYYTILYMAARCYPDNPWFVRVCSARPRLAVFLRSQVLICVMGCIGPELQLADSRSFTVIMS